MRRIAGLVAGLVFVICIAASYAHVKAQVRSDEYIRNRVLMLTGKGIECSAIEITAPSGKIYTLSAAHCSEMLSNGFLDATAEDGSMKVLKVVDIDKAHDLMLLEAYDKNSVKVAKNNHKYQKVHTLAHGRGMPTYRTDGYLLADKVVALTEEVYTEDQMNQCTKDGRALTMTMLGFGCEFKLILTMSTAAVVPGSSGGAVLNADGELVGIVSATDGFFSAFVPLKDIHYFLKNR
jgi:Trypsin-like peptidase domain